MSKRIPHRLMAVAVITFTASCGSAPPNPDGNLRIVSRDWINPSLRDIHATLDLRRIDTKSYGLKYAFSVPLDPVNGVNPTEFHLFTFCIASKLTKQAQRSHWALGSFEKNTKYQNTKSLELFVATLNEGESPPSLTSDSKQVFWVMSSQSADSFYQACSRMLRIQQMWVAPDQK